MKLEDVKIGQIVICDNTNADSVRDKTACVIEKSNIHKGVFFLQFNEPVDCADENNIIGVNSEMFNPFKNMARPPKFTTEEIGNDLTDWLSSEESINDSRIMTLTAACGKFMSYVATLQRQFRLTDAEVVQMCEQLTYLHKKNAE